MTEASCMGVLAVSPIPVVMEMFAYRVDKRLCHAVFMVTAKVLSLCRHSLLSQVFSFIISLLTTFL